MDVASENELQCVMQSAEKTHYVANKGSHPSRFSFQRFLQVSNLIWVADEGQKKEN